MCASSSRRGFLCRICRLSDCAWLWIQPVPPAAALRCILAPPAIAPSCPVPATMAVSGPKACAFAAVARAVSAPPRCWSHAPVLFAAIDSRSVTIRRACWCLCRCTVMFACFRWELVVRCSPPAIQQEPQPGSTDASLVGIIALYFVWLSVLATRSPLLPLYADRLPQTLA